MAGLLPLQHRLRPMVETFVPATRDIDAARYRKLVEGIDARLAEEPPALTRQLRILVTILYFLPILCHLCTFAGLTAAQRQRFLERFQDGPIATLRVGIWGLRTLAFVGWYADPDVGRQLGWRAGAGGWQAWRAAHPATAPQVGSSSAPG